MKGVPMAKNKLVQIIQVVIVELIAIINPELAQELFQTGRSNKRWKR